MLFALAVAGLALGAAATALRGGLVGERTTRDLDTALAVAQSALASAGADAPLKPGETHGDFAGYRWRLTVAPYRDKDTDAEPMALYRVEAQVNWSDGGSARSFAVSTLRLGPAAQ